MNASNVYDILVSYIAYDEVCFEELRICSESPQEASELAVETIKVLGGIKVQVEDINAVIA